MSFASEFGTSRGFGLFFFEAFFAARSEWNEEFLLVGF
jgi:hypothetical protein